MDFFDQRILTALKDGKPHGFTALQSQVGFSHNTLQQHLTRLVEKGLVIKEARALTSGPRLLDRLLSFSKVSVWTW